MAERKAHKLTFEGELSISWQGTSLDVDLHASLLDSIPEELNEADLIPSTICSTGAAEDGDSLAVGRSHHYSRAGVLWDRWLLILGVSALTQSSHNYLTSQSKMAEPIWSDSLHKQTCGTMRILLL